MKHNDAAEGKLQKRGVVISLPDQVERFFSLVAGLFEFSIHFFKEAFVPPYEFKEVIRQAYHVGVRSLALVGITGFIMGLVLTLQSKPIMIEFGAEAFIPSMVSISIIREIGPVITALICAGKISSGMGAEIGSMKVTEQIDAMEVSGTNPFNYIVVTRVIATTLMVPILVFYADTVGILGAWLGVNIEDKITLELFLRKAFDALFFSDVLPATIKTFFFGFTIGLIGCYMGYNAKRGTESVGEAANTAVVIASLAIFILDMIAVQLTQLIVGV